MTITHEQLAERLDRGDRRFCEIEKKLDKVTDDTAAIREILEALQGLKTLGKIAMAISKPILAVGATIAMAWGVFKLAVLTITKGG